MHIKHHGNVQPSYNSGRKLLKLVRQSHHPQWNQSWTNMDWKNTQTGRRDYSKSSITVCKCTQAQRPSFLETCPDECLRNLKLNCLAIMTIIWRKKRKSWEHHPTVKYGGGSIMLRDWWTSQNSWHHQERRLCRNIEITSQDSSQEVKAWGQMGLPTGSWPWTYHLISYKVS